MSDQLAFVVVTPYTIQKSRTGAVIARLLGRCESELIAAQMFAPTRELVDAYAGTIRRAENSEDEIRREWIRDYIRANLGPDSSGMRRRVLLLVFRGENAHDDLRQVAGHLRISCTSGETIRDTYGAANHRLQAVPPVCGAGARVLWFGAGGVEAQIGPWYRYEGATPSGARIWPSVARRY